MITQCECNSGFVLSSTAKDDDYYHTCENGHVCPGERFQGVASIASMVAPFRDPFHR